MKRINLLIAPTLLAVSVLLAPATAKAQDAKKAEFESTWYDACYTSRDRQKCYELSKELVAKYPQSAYLTNAQGQITTHDRNKAAEKFQADLQAYYNPPQEAAELEQLFASGEAYLKFVPDDPFVVAHQALAGINAALGQRYQNLEKVKGYADPALKSFAAASPAEGWKAEDWATMRNLVLAQGNQFLGWVLINQDPDPAKIPKNDLEQALKYLSRAIQVRSADGTGWKDPHNYWLRSIVYSNQYGELRRSYDAMSDEQKLGETGKEVLKQVNDLLDATLIPEYARVLATATKPETQHFYEAAKPWFEAFWRYRTNDPAKASAYVKNYVGDPPVASVAVPVKAEDTDPPIAPATGPTNLKLSAGGASAVPGAGAKVSPNGNGGKSKSSKKTTKTPPKRKGKKR
ncbi:MAG TPA: hypothetical protein VJ302_21645 [Blastocatellia bacterium]|nr:hypothetical protein [Blastocatellia bacterium]